MFGMIVEIGQACTDLQNIMDKYTENLIIQPTQFVLVKTEP